ncbi:MAG TPA: LLM class flavin-dependent oxidoreductase [Acidimicrobiales bacterium]|nr:LLM class flavin-dependent oxidoreductase [Acidimicrobiales bacterium]
MKVGITLPQFRDDAETAIETAKLAEAAGLDGVFVFDHLWPIGRPDRPALHSIALLGALAVETERVAIGTLVARVGLLPDAVLVNALVTVDRMAGGRLIAGLGVGDRLSRAENEAFAVPFAPVPERMASLVECCRQLRATGVTTWVGGLSERIRRVAAAEGVALNLWGVDADAVAAVAPAEVTWAGQVGPDVDLRAHLRAVEDAGATWAVCAPVGRPWADAVKFLGEFVR